MQKIKCIIIEDEPLAAGVLADYIQEVPFLELIHSFKEAISATSFLQEHPIDLIILDLHLPKIKGLDFLRTLSNPPNIIVTTAYHQYAIEGYELNVTDYLLKPFSFNRFLTAVNKVVKLTDTSNIDAIFITINRKKVRILFNEILYIESKKEYVQIHTESGIYTTKMGTAQLEALLPVTGFKRIHRSYIVSIYKIKAYAKDHVEINGKNIPIGKNFRKGFSL